MNHTPTPWKIGEDRMYLYFLDDALEAGLIPDEQAHPAHDTVVCNFDVDTHPGIDPEENCAFAQVAINAHDSLVQALKDIIQEAQSDREQDYDFEARITAIAEEVLKKVGL